MKRPTFATWNENAVILTFYVDDLLPVGQNKVMLKQLEKKLLHRFDTKCIGDISMVIEMHVTPDREEGTLNISQGHYTMPVLRMYGMRDCKPMYTIEVAPDVPINQVEGNPLTNADTQRYQSIVGSVMYLAQVSRYDIL